MLIRVEVEVVVVVECGVGSAGGCGGGKREGVSAYSASPPAQLKRWKVATY
jgi:hypothetical protein